MEVEGVGGEVELLIAARLSTQVETRSRIHSRFSQNFWTNFGGFGGCSTTELTEPVGFRRLRDCAIGLSLRSGVAEPVASGLIFYAEGLAAPYVLWSDFRDVATSNGGSSEPFAESRSGIGVRGRAEAGMRYAIAPGVYASAGGYVDHRTRAGSFAPFGPGDRLPFGDVTEYGVFAGTTFGF